MISLMFWRGDKFFSTLSCEGILEDMEEFALSIRVLGIVSTFNYGVSMCRKLACVDKLCNQK